MLNLQNKSLHGVAVVQATGNVASNMDGEKVLLSVKNSKYYNLGEIGGSIWDLIEKPISVSKLIDALMEQYAVNQTECEEQVINFLELLYKEDLIQTEKIVNL